jgi:threonine/homoserine/homoserine lactone efflux protein
MDPAVYLRGVAIGFAVAFALGPVGLLVIRRTIERGWWHGFVSGLGVATADGLYAAIAAFGLTALTSLLVGLDRALGIAGGAVLLVLALRGLRTIRTASGAEAVADPEAPRHRTTSLSAWATMVGLTLTNPATILSFTALFASIGAGTGGPAGAGTITAGVFCGSAGWWLLLTAIVAGLRARMTAAVVRRLNLVASLIIAAFGMGAITIGILAGGAP